MKSYLLIEFSPFYLFIYIYRERERDTPGVTPKKLHLFYIIDFYEI